MLKLRRFALRDLEQYRGWVNDPETARLLGRRSPNTLITREEHQRWYVSLVQDHILKGTAKVFAIECARVYVGNVWLWCIDYQDREAEVRIVLGSTAERGKGTGTEALRSITRYAFAEMELSHLYAYVLTYNLWAKRAFEKAGFVHERTLTQERQVDGKYEDAYLMTLIRKEV